MNTKSMLMVITGFLFFMGGPVFAAGDANAGETKSATCTGCHGADGLGVGDYPAIAGVDYQVLVGKMTAYRSKEKEEMMMNMLFEPMSDDDIADLAAYFSSLAAAR